MKIYKTEKIIKEEIKIEKIVCNKCGKDINYDNSEFVEIVKNWGFYSKKDMVTQIVDICESCWDSLVANLKIPPKEIEEFIE